MEIDKQTSARLADAFQAFCDSPDRIVMPAGYRDSAFAVVDSVFSMQARYEGVRRVVANYASYANIPQVPGLPVDASERDQHSVRDLHDRLHGLSAEEAATKVFGNRSCHARADRLKAGLVLDVTSRLVDAGVHTRQDVALLPNATRHSEQKRAWTAVRGLGPVTFEYFRMLCGAESSKPDTRILGWLADTLGQRFTWRHALGLIAALTDELSHHWGVPIAQRGVDHTIWRQQVGPQLKAGMRLDRATALAYRRPGHAAHLHRVGGEACLVNTLNSCGDATCPWQRGRREDGGGRSSLPVRAWIVSRRARTAPPWSRTGQSRFRKRQSRVV